MDRKLNGDRMACELYETFHRKDLSVLADGKRCLGCSSGDVLWCWKLLRSSTLRPDCGRWIKERKGSPTTTWRWQLFGRNLIWASMRSGIALETVFGTRRNLKTNMYEFLTGLNRDLDNVKGSDVLCLQRVKYFQKLRKKRIDAEWWWQSICLLGQVGLRCQP